MPDVQTQSWSAAFVAVGAVSEGSVRCLSAILRDRVGEAMSWDGGDESRVQALMAENQRLEVELDAAVTLIRRLQDERDLLRAAVRDASFKITKHLARDA